MLSPHMIRQVSYMHSRLASFKKNHNARFRLLWPIATGFVNHEQMLKIEVESIQM